MNKYSFIIPVYNCKKYLEACVHGIETLDLADYEIILVDDGSKDGSAALCDELKKKNNKICCLHQKNQGVSAARNHGLQLAKGDYVLFFDADDTIETKKLCLLLKKLETRTDIDMAVFGIFVDYYHNAACYRSDEIKISLSEIKNSFQWIPELKSLYLSNSLNPVWNKVFSRRLLIEHTLHFREDMFLYEDLEFTLRCMSYSNLVLFEPNGIYHYRQSEDEGNAARRLMRIDCISWLVHRIEKSLDDFIKIQRAQKWSEGIRQISLLLFLVLAREKISVSNTEQIRQICGDFSEWFRNRKNEISADDQAFVNQLLHQKVRSLILHREYIKVRHKIAVTVKNTKLYQKIRGSNGY